jgi:Protein of unknown function (DUF1329)
VANKGPLVRSTALAIATLLASLTISVVFSEAADTQSPGPGTTIDADNLSNYRSFLPAAVELAIEHGFSVQVVPAKRLDRSGSFAEATEKYSPQVGLDKDDILIKYVAGMPFPIVSMEDPKAAIKIAYNWHMGPFMPDDFSLEPWGSFTYALSDSTNTFTHEDTHDYVCNKFMFLRYAHRTEIHPRPTLGANEDGVEWKSRCDNWTMDADGNAGAKGIWIRYLDPRKIDEFFYFSRRAGRMGRMDSYDALDDSCRTCHQPYWAYALPKTEQFTYRLLGTVPLLACLTAGQEPAGILHGDKGATFGTEPFQLRNAYVLEMTPRIPGYEHLPEIVYIDTEAYIWLGAEFYDEHERTATAFPLWRSQPAPSGGYHFDLAGEFYFRTGELQSRHEQVNGRFPFVHEQDVTSSAYFRSMAPAHGNLSQKINIGDLSENRFLPKSLSGRER